MTSSEAHSDIALELYVVGTGKFEGIEARHQGLRVWILLPLAKDRWIGGATVLIRHRVLVHGVALRCLGNAVARESTVNRFIKKQQQTIIFYNKLKIF